MWQGNLADISVWQKILSVACLLELAVLGFYCSCYLVRNFYVDISFILCMPCALFMMMPVSVMAFGPWDTPGGYLIHAVVGLIGVVVMRPINFPKKCFEES